MDAARTRPAGAPVAIAALVAYALLTAMMPAGPLRTVVAAMLPLTGMCVMMGASVARLQRVGADQQATRRMLEMAGSFAIASPILAFAAYWTG